MLETNEKQKLTENRICKEQTPRRIKEQTEMKSTITDMKKTLEGISSRITEAEGQISDLEDSMVEFTAAEQKKEKRMKRNEDTGKKM